MKYDDTSSIFKLAKKSLAYHDSNLLTVKYIGIADLYSHHFKDLPSAARRYLNKTVDWDQDNVDTDLYKIAHYMTRWVYLAPQLGLDDIDVGDIKQDHRAAKEQRLANNIFWCWTSHNALENYICYVY